MTSSQLLAIAAVASTAALLLGTWRCRHSVTGWAAGRLGMLAVGGVVFTPWAIYWGLLTP